VAIRPPGTEAGDQAVAVTSLSRACFRLEFGGTQGSCQGLAGLRGGQRGAWSRQASQRAAAFGQGCGAVGAQEKGIGGSIHRAPRVCRLAKNQGQDDLASRQMQAVHARCCRWPVGL
jgi:hypothetical protein